MNRRSFLKWLGIGVPAAAVASVVVPALGTSVPEKVSAKLGEWNNYFSEGEFETLNAIENWKSYPVHHTATLYYDKDLVQTLKAENTKFLDLIASNKKIPMNMGAPRKFFQYNGVS